MLFVPSGISIIWFTIMGGTTIWQKLNGTGITVAGAGENVLSICSPTPPFSPVMMVVGLIAIVIFFVADSSTNAMGSIS